MSSRIDLILLFLKQLASVSDCGTQCPVQYTGRFLETGYEYSRLLISDNLTAPKPVKEKVPGK